MKRAIPPVPSKYGQTFMPLHMATFLRESDFEKLSWPTFSRTVQALADVGQPVFMFCEHDWMRYLDYLYELPENTRIGFEFGDARLVKQKLGKRHILSGLYPMTCLKTATKQQCIDKADENAGKKFIQAGDIKPFKSKYYKTWEEYKAEHPEIPPDLEPVISKKLRYMKKCSSCCFD